MTLWKIESYNILRKLRMFLENHYDSKALYVHSSQYVMQRPSCQIHCDIIREIVNSLLAKHRIMVSKQLSWSLVRNNVSPNTYQTSFFSLRLKLVFTESLCTEDKRTLLKAMILENSDQILIFLGSLYSLKWTVFFFVRIFIFEFFLKFHQKFHSPWPLAGNFAKTSISC